MMPFLSWSHLACVFVLAGVCVMMTRSERYRAIFVANLAMGTLLLGWSLAVPLTVAALNFLAVAKLRSQKSKNFLVLVCAFNLLPLLMLRSTIDFNFRNLLLSFTLCFFCLQQIGSMIDFHRGRVPLPKNFLHWMSYAIFFPSMLAGPIGRWGELQERLLNPAPFERGRAIEAILLCAQAIFKKMVFAVPFLLMAERFCKSPASYGPTAAIAIAFIFRYGIWADVSAHTDWARGTSSLLGIDLRPNFDRPFQTTRIAEFWRRWHMSLSSWLQDYVFFPLALGPFRRWFHPRIAQAAAVLISFSCFGLWHGLTFSLLIMGLYKGVGVLISESIERRLDRRVLWHDVVGHVVAIAMLAAFVMLPTLLLGATLDQLRPVAEQAVSAISNGDPLWPSSWKSLTSLQDAAVLTEIPVLALATVGLGWETLEFVSRRGRVQAADASTRAELAGAALWARLLAFSVAFIVWLVLAHFGTDLEFMYVKV